MPGVEVTDETGKLPPYVSTVLSFAVARFGTMEETVGASRNVSALLNFATYPIVFPLRSLRGRCRLRQMRCYYIRAAGATLLLCVSVLLILKSIVVGASIARPFIMVSSAAPDRADAKTVSVSAQKRH